MTKFTTLQLKEFIRKTIKEDKALTLSNKRREEFKKKFKESSFSSIKFVVPGDIHGLVKWLNNPINWKAAADAVSHGNGTENDLVNFIKMHPEFDDWSWGQIKTAIDDADNNGLLESLRNSVAESKKKIVLPESKIRLIFKLLSEAPPQQSSLIPDNPLVPDPNAGLSGAPPIPPAPAGDVAVPPIDVTATPGADIPGTDTDTGASEEEGTTKNAPTDPVSEIITTVTDMLEKTQDIPELLKAVKAEIQTKFEKPIHALGVIQALADTKNATLRRVAARLLLFIKDSMKESK